MLRQVDLRGQAPAGTVSFQGQRDVVLILALEQVEVELEGTSIDHTVGDIQHLGADLWLHRRANRVLAFNSGALD